MVYTIIFVFYITFVFFGKLVTDNYKKIYECTKQIEKLEIQIINLEKIYNGK